MSKSVAFGAAVAAGYFIATKLAPEQLAQAKTTARELADDTGLAATAGAIAGRLGEFWADLRHRFG